MKILFFLILIAPGLSFAKDEKPKEQQLKDISEKYTCEVTPREYKLEKGGVVKIKSMELSGNRKLVPVEDLAGATQTVAMVEATEILKDLKQIDKPIFRKVITDCEQQRNMAIAASIVDVTEQANFLRRKVGTFPTGNQRAGSSGILSQRKGTCTAENRSACAPIKTDNTSKAQDAGN